MTDYGAMAERHWARWLPTRYAAIPDPKTPFFVEIGQQAQDQIEQLAEELAGPDIPGEEYLTKVGRFNEARMRAREIVLPELVLLAPEPGTDPNELDEDPNEADPAAEPATSSSELPLVVSPGDPEYASILEEEERSRQSRAE
jgi:hypothetical protein